MADAEITEAIRAFLGEVIAEHARSGGVVERKFSLVFQYLGKQYSTILDVMHNGYKIRANNDCLKVEFVPDKQEFSSRINADSAGLNCFKPPLVSDPREKDPPRITSLDVLQILKTKLTLAFPVKEDVNVIIVDMAMKNGINISPFNVIRGGNAIYEKYGYRNVNLNDLKEKLKSFTWSFCNREIRRIIEHCTGRAEWPPEMPLIDIMNTIPWELEKVYNKNVENEPLSLYIFYQFAKTVGERTETIWTFQLDRDSPAWRQCNSQLVFTDFTPIASAGGRRRRKAKTVQRRRSTGRRRRLQTRRRRHRPF